MKLTTLKIKNFRSYKDEITIHFDNLTTFVGRNDIGKSTILEALDIFFNEGKGTVKLDKDDINKESLSEGDKEIIISASFTGLPDEIIIDSENKTTLLKEYLLNSNGQLEIIKKYHNAGAAKIFINAYHPTNSNCRNLLQKTNQELKAIIDKNKIPCDDKTRNAILRESIWQYYGTDLQLSEVEIDVSTKGDTKSIAEHLQKYLPLYSLFQSDRKNSDGDSEIQDPLKEAVKQILQVPELKQTLNEVASKVSIKLQDVSKRTLEKLREMNPEIANNLNPEIPDLNSLKWADVFKSVSISGDNDIPINKRGSGVKRLILLNFFRAEAERRREEESVPSIIYAIEEPETAQHSAHQRLLIDAFLKLVEIPNTQIILTTHSAQIVKKLSFEHLRLISKNGNIKEIKNVLPSSLPYPSLNELNYQAFIEITDEYHNELYGYLEENDLLHEYKADKPKIKYNKVYKDKHTNTLTTKEEQIVLTEYIRHQIHHPENRNNIKYTDKQLRESIEAMRDFILRASAEKVEER